MNMYIYITEGILEKKKQGQLSEKSRGCNLLAFIVAPPANNGILQITLGFPASTWDLHVYNLQIFTELLFCAHIMMTCVGILYSVYVFVSYGFICMTCTISVKLQGVHDMLVAYSVYHIRHVVHRVRNMWYVLCEVT